MKSKQHSISTHKKVRYFRMDVDNVLGVASMVQRGSIAWCTNVIAGSHKIFHEKNIISITRIWTVSRISIWTCTKTYKLPLNL